MFFSRTTGLLIATSIALLSPSHVHAYGQIAQVVDANNFCVFLPPNDSVDRIISDTEWNAQAFCIGKTPLAKNAGKLKSGFIQSAHFVATDQYVQVTGQIDPTKARLDLTDEGGQMDIKAPKGSSCAGWKYYVNLIEPAGRTYCMRCCNDDRTCNRGISEKGCAHIIPGDYSGPYGDKPSSSSPANIADDSDKKDEKSAAPKPIKTVATHTTTKTKTSTKKSRTITAIAGTGIATNAITSGTVINNANADKADADKADEGKANAGKADEGKADADETNAEKATSDDNPSSSGNNPVTVTNDAPIATETINESDSARQEKPKQEEHNSNEDVTTIIDAATPTVQIAPPSGTSVINPSIAPVKGELLSDDGTIKEQSVNAVNAFQPVIITTATIMMTMVFYLIL
ncbi:hypothetical protein BDF20DRAFT_861950 [Mycotypha africana]|uniref:uncharacterized protein n=1 Tax=Mycotypha africana TaxID=64632 RepID=UPI002301CF1C|nr:uncharacterized protein BDF20DRAFT_861950 [Mycotypha africana]KAI8981593.1 hypothetical protein BDF20DRAFT_861950 [Mycotypha africana]